MSLAKWSSDESHSVPLLVLLSSEVMETFYHKIRLVSAGKWNPTASGYFEGSFSTAPSLGGKNRLVYILLGVLLHNTFVFSLCFGSLMAMTKPSIFRSPFRSPSLGRLIWKLDLFALFSLWIWIRTSFVRIVLAVVLSTCPCILSALSLSCFSAAIYLSLYIQGVSAKGEQNTSEKSTNHAEKVFMP